MRSRERKPEAQRSGGGWAARLGACLIATAMLTLTAGCSTVGMLGYRTDLAPVIPPRGYFYTHFRAPLVLPVHDAERATPVRGSSRGVIYVKIPVVSADFAGGRADLQDAVRRAGITRLLYADYEYMSLLGYIRTFNVRAYGYKD
ncbi:hypothetical protein JW916_06250 [Candidatus Sumerlaeota bacterium]|nr:hypothetical protein [Candidatus Sumerlaeota bacterium]